MGAVISAALAAGSSSDRLLEIARSLERKDFAALDAWALAKGVFAGSILKPGPLKHTIARLVPATRFADLQIPLTVTTTDLDSGELVLFGALGQDGPLIDVLYASCALPLYLPPQTIGGRRLAEGGLRPCWGSTPHGASRPISWWRWTWAPGSTSRRPQNRRASRRWCGRTARRSA